MKFAFSKKFEIYSQIQGTTYRGFSNQELEELSSPPPLPHRGLSFWVHWESENASLGKTFRHWSFYPAFLPLFFSSEHGVNWGSKCMPNETNNNSKLFLTWNKKKRDIMIEVHKKKSICVPHPWVNYRRKKYPDLPEVRRGTLVFWPHTGVATGIKHLDERSYFKKIINLPTEFHPIYLCLSFQDINEGLHKRFRKYNLPIVTAGHTNSQFFVDRFYRLIYNFKYATSNDLGSQVYYCIEAGIPYFLYGEPVKLINKVKSNPEQLVYRTESEYGDFDDIERVQLFRKGLEEINSLIPETQRRLVHDYLGINSGVSRLTGIIVIWGSFFKNLHLFVLLTFKFLVKLLRYLISKNR